jgi:serine/threonine protein kinase
LPHSDTLPVPPDLSRNGYEVIHCIGQGAVATVWKAKLIESGEFVAIKLLRSEEADLETIQRFSQEVSLLKELGHPGIVNVYHTGVTHHANPFVVMEWIDGTSLRFLLDRENTLPLNQVDQINSQLAAALALAHSKEIVHRDLKPENLLLTPGANPHVKVVDFGMAKLLRPEAPELTLRNAIFGTPQYMSPERAMGREITSAADVYAMGIMVYEMVSGRRPFDARQPTEVLIKHVKGDVPALEGIPDNIENVVCSALAKEPQDRPSALEFGDRLTAAIAANA